MSTEQATQSEASQHLGEDPSLDPLAVLLSDPAHHISDLLYIHFRMYKSRTLSRFIKTAIARLQLKPDDDFNVTDIGASMGFDTLYLLREWTSNFKKPLPCRSVQLSLIEGDAKSIAKGTQLLKESIKNPAITFEYFHYPIIEPLPLKNESQHVAICSEVVEHLEHPEKLFAEIFRTLKPGGFFLLTTDNSPNLLQRIRRIPVWLSGRYKTAYARPSLESETTGRTEWNGKVYPLYGHINLNPTRHWEKLLRNVGFRIAEFGTYESIRRGGGGNRPINKAVYFLAGALAYHAMPRRLARFFGDTTALLLQRPN